MKGNVVGFQTVDYFSEKKQKQVKGVNLVINYNHNDYHGRASKEEFIPADSAFFIRDLLPILNGNADSLIGAEVYIDYLMEKKGQYTFSTIVDFSITPAKKAG